MAFLPLAVGSLAVIGTIAALAIIGSIPRVRRRYARWPRHDWPSVAVGFNAVLEWIAVAVVLLIVGLGIHAIGLAILAVLR